MAEDLVEVPAKITLETPKKMKTKSLKTNLRSHAITCKERGILRMKVESPRRKDRRRTLRRSTLSGGRERSNSSYGYRRIRKILASRCLSMSFKKRYVVS